MQQHAARAAPKPPHTPTTTYHAPPQPQDAYLCRPLPYTRRVPQLASSLDQLWLSAHARVTSLLHATHASDGGGMPSAHQPSDHLPLGAVVVFPAAVVAGGGAAAG
jgi:hypothetical protein